MDHYSTAKKYFNQKNLILAEIFCRKSIEKSENNDLSFLLLSKICLEINMPQFLKKYILAIVDKKKFGKEILNIKKKKKEKRIFDKINDTKYIIIKSWGFGFFSDVSCVLGSLFLAELTNRTPVIIWGNNSLFNSNNKKDCFTDFFQPVSNISVEDINLNKSIFPPKWDSKNIHKNNFNKWNDNYSRLGALYFLNRVEKIIVVDFHIAVIDLMDWINENSKFYGFTLKQVLYFLIKKYLNPVEEIKDFCNQYIKKNLDNKPFSAIHLRGSDKVFEGTQVIENNKELIKLLLKDKKDKIFLLTDSQIYLNLMKKEFKERLFYLDCIRTDSQIGLHHQNIIEKRKLAIEVLKDVCIAQKAEQFYGCGDTNISNMIWASKNWNKKKIIHIGENRWRTRNSFIYTMEYD